MFKRHLKSYLTKTKLFPLLNCSPSHLSTCSPFSCLLNAKATSYPGFLFLSQSMCIHQQVPLALPPENIRHFSLSPVLSPRCKPHLSHRTPVMANVSLLYFLREAKAIFSKCRSDCASSLPLRMKSNLLR